MRNTYLYLYGTLITSEQTMAIVAESRLGDMFSARARRLACLGHLLMAAPNPMIMCIGSFIAGIGWILSKARLKRVVGSLLIAYGSSLSIVTAWLSLAGLAYLAESPLSYTGILNGELVILSGITLVVGVTAYGMLMVSLFDLAKRSGIVLFRGAATSLAFTIIMLFFTATILVVAASTQGVFGVSNVDILFTTFELSMTSLMVMNLIGNLLAGLGFLKRS